MSGDKTWNEFRREVAAWMPQGRGCGDAGTPTDDLDAVEWRGGTVFARCRHCDRVFDKAMGEALIHECPVTKGREVLPTKMASITIKLETT